MTIDALIAQFEGWADPAWQADWDNCGWQIEPGIGAESARVLVCLTPTAAVMEEAGEAGANLVFAHHPLFFTGLKSVRRGEALGDLLHFAFTRHIGVYSAHTNLDQVGFGTAGLVATQLGLVDARPLEETGEGRGYGRVGDLAEPTSLAALMGRIRALLEPPELLHGAADLTREIRRVAVLGGSGASYADAARQAGADVFLTGDVKFHQFQEARDRGLVVIDAGHFATERPACSELVRRFLALGCAWARLSERDEDFRVFGADARR